MSFYVWILSGILWYTFFLSSLLLSSLARRRFHPRQTSGQAMVTGVYPSPPPVRAFIVCRAYYIGFIQHSHCSSIFIECNLLTLSCFPPINFLMQEKVPTSMHSVRLEPTKLILIDTRTTYQATGEYTCTGVTVIHSGTAVSRHLVIRHCHGPAVTFSFFFSLFSFFEEKGFPK